MVFKFRFVFVLPQIPQNFPSKKKKNSLENARVFIIQVEANILNFLINLLLLYFSLYSFVSSPFPEKNESWKNGLGISEMCSCDLGSAFLRARA